MVAKKKFVKAVGEDKTAKTEGGIVDEQVSRIYSMLERNHERILDIHDRLGGPFPRGQEEVPDDMDQVIISVLDYILSRLAAQENTIEAIHENISNKIGRIRLY